MPTHHDDTLLTDDAITQQNISQGSNSQQQTNDPIDTDECTLHYFVNGMDCSSCAHKIENSLIQIPVIKSAKVNFSTTRLTVVLGSTTSIQSSTKQITSQLKKLGFSVTKDLKKTPEKLNNMNQITQWIKQNTIFSIILSSTLLGGISTLASFHTIALSFFYLTSIIGLIYSSKKAYNLIKTGLPMSIEILMMIAVIGAIFLGDIAEAATVITLFLIGEHLESYAGEKARKGIRQLMSLTPDKVRLVKPDGSIEQILATDAKPQQVIKILPGERLAADGLLIDDHATLDTSVLTGESKTTHYTKNQQLLAGFMVIDQPIHITITSEPNKNAIDRIIRLVEEAENRQSPTTRLMQKISQKYTPCVIIIALIVAFIAPLIFGGSWQEWIYKALTLLLISCPCALVIATPTAITAALTTASKFGILIKDGFVLENIGKIKTMVFDKTGTITTGKLTVAQFSTFNHYNKNSILQLLADIESQVNHPIAQALVHYAETQNIYPAQQLEMKIKQLHGQGVSSSYQGSNINIGSIQYLNHIIQQNTTEIQEHIKQLQKQPYTMVAVAIDNQIAAIMSLNDVLNTDTHNAINQIKERHIECMIFTGDSEKIAHRIATQLNIPFIAQMLPEDKLTEIEKLKQKNSVAMVGDGINDAPALKLANIGIAVTGSTDIALEAADCALTTGHLKKLPWLIDLSRATLNKIYINITIALGLKFIFLLTTILGLTGLWMAIVADTGATLLVTINALTLLSRNSSLSK